MKAERGSRYTLYTLHGFLGLPSDWNMLSGDTLPVDSIVHCNLWTQDEVGLWEWAKQFNNSLPKKENRILLGYSLGGRLAMHALLDNPKFWSAAIIVSADPGVETLAEKTVRWQCDLKWANRFLSDPWEEVIANWNDRKVFSGGKTFFVRHERDYSRLSLATSLQNWSLGRQDNLRPLLKNLPVPLLWIAGENDLIYKNIANNMTFSNCSSQVWVAPGAGHRVPWDCSEAFQQKISEFICNHMYTLWVVTILLFYP
jgi:2-succinyl-6-hydroxy-2,4-cyclohexadiene-1-carboxylate synthase